MIVLATAQTESGEYGPVVLTPMIGGKHHARILDGPTPANYADATRFEVSSVASLRARAQEVFAAIPDCKQIRVGKYALPGTDAEHFASYCTVSRIVERYETTVFCEVDSIVPEIFRREQGN